MTDSSIKLKSGAIVAGPGKATSRSRRIRNSEPAAFASDGNCRPQQVQDDAALIKQGLDKALSEEVMNANVRQAVLKARQM